MKHYTVYKTTNVVTGDYYIGTHVTSDPHDAYLGSGKRLNNAIKKYGRESFSKEVLFDFANNEDMFLKEKELVNETVLKDPKCLNLIVGGLGGFSYINNNGIKKFHGKNHSRASIEKMLETKKKKGNYYPTESRRIEIAEANRKKAQDSNWRATMSDALSGKTKTNEHKEKIAQSLKGKKQEKVQCPHCKRTGGIRAFKRYHFDNCKMRG